MTGEIAASTPKELEVKPTALGILLDAQGANWGAGAGLHHKGRLGRRVVGIMVH